VPLSRLGANAGIHDGVCHRVFSHSAAAPNTITVSRANRTGGACGADSAPSDTTDIKVFEARAYTIRHRDWISVNERRERYRARWAEFFRDFDVLLCPVMSGPAIAHDHSEPVGQRTLVVNGVKEQMPACICSTLSFGWTKSTKCLLKRNSQKTNRIKRSERERSREPTFTKCMLIVTRFLGRARYGSCTREMFSNSSPADRAMRMEITSRKNLMESVQLRFSRA
jgi:hypothetical protein